MDPIVKLVIIAAIIIAIVIVIVKNIKNTKIKEEMRIIMDAIKVTDVDMIETNF